MLHHVSAGIILSCVFYTLVHFVWISNIWGTRETRPSYMPLISTHPLATQYFPMYLNAFLSSIIKSITGHTDSPIAQIPQCISQISYNVPFCNRNKHTCADVYYKMVLVANKTGALWDLCNRICYLGVATIHLNTKVRYPYIFVMPSILWCSRK